MKRVFLPLLTLIAAFAEQAGAQQAFVEPRQKPEMPDSYRSNLSLQLSYKEYSENNLSDTLKLHGIDTDEFSQVFTHQEQAGVDLHCFNCIVNPRDVHARISNPENELLAK